MYDDDDNDDLAPSRAILLGLGLGVAAFLVAFFLFL